MAPPRPEGELRLRSNGPVTMQPRRPAKTTSLPARTVPSRTCATPGLSTVGRAKRPRNTPRRHQRSGALGWPGDNRPCFGRSGCTRRQSLPLVLIVQAGAGQGRRPVRRLPKVQATASTPSSSTKNPGSDRVRGFDSAQERPLATILPPAPRLGHGRFRTRRLDGPISSSLGPSLSHRAGPGHEHVGVCLLIDFRLGPGVQMRNRSVINHDIRDIRLGEWRSRLSTR